MVSLSPEFLLIAGRAVFLVFSFVVAAIAFTSWRRAAQQESERATAHMNLVLERLGALERAIAAAQARIGEVADQVDGRLLAGASAGGGPSYQVAIRLARSGASCDELVASCGLSRLEAELVRRLHGPREPSARAAAAAR